MDESSRVNREHSSSLWTFFNFLFLTTFLSQTVLSVLQKQHEPAGCNPTVLGLIIHFTYTAFVPAIKTQQRFEKEDTSYENDTERMV